MTCVFLYNRNNENDRWIAVLLMYIGIMQFLEYLMWLDQNCTGTNQLATSMAYYHSLLQPFASLFVAYLFTKGNIHPAIYISYLLYLMFSVPYIVEAKEPNQCSKPCKESKLGLSWPYTNTKSSMTWIIFLVALVSPFLMMKKNGAFYAIFISLLYLVSVYISDRRCKDGRMIPSSGSWWCLMAAFIPTSAIFINK